MYPTAVVTGKGAQRWRGGHPWIFRSDVRVAPDVPAGAVRVVDERQRQIGVALWSPASEISLRMVSAQGDTALTDEWWRLRLSEAAARRDVLRQVTNAYRVVHGEADGIPSLICDRYDAWLVVQFNSAGLEAFRDSILRALVEIFEPAGILARNDIPLREREGLPRETVVLHGDVPQEVEVFEDDVRYLAAPWTGQKTGAFLDQRENRRRAGMVARGRALDCFSYHGSFALHLARRADHVIALDSSAEALQRAQANAAVNGSSNIEFLEANAFDYLRDRDREGARFDTIVLDPPAFARTRGSLPGALRGYHEINLRAMKLLTKGGLLLSASCSYHLTKPLFLEMLEGAARDSGRRITLREILAQPLDHPEILTIPETGYIKAALLEAMD